MLSYFILKNYSVIILALSYASEPLKYRPGLPHAKSMSLQVVALSVINISDLILFARHQILYAIEDADSLRLKNYSMVVTNCCESYRRSLYVRVKKNV